MAYKFKIPYTNKVVTLTKHQEKYGATFDSRGKELKYKKGYQVSTKRPEITQKQAISVFKQMGVKRKDLNWGVWLQDGKVTFEPSINVEAEQSAMNIAGLTNQEAILDWKNSKPNNPKYISNTNHNKDAKIAFKKGSIQYGGK